MRTISDVARVERAEETILQHDQDTGERIKVAAPPEIDGVSALDGKRARPRVNFRPDKPLHLDTIVKALKITLDAAPKKGRSYSDDENRNRFQKAVLR